MTDFEQLVYAMRHAQRQYFRSRENCFLAESKHYEGLVDKHLDEVRLNQRQPPLFDLDANGEGKENAESL